MKILKIIFYAIIDFFIIPIRFVYLLFNKSDEDYFNIIYKGFLKGLNIFKIKNVGVVEEKYSYENILNCRMTLLENNINEKYWENDIIKQMLLSFCINNNLEYKKFLTINLDDRTYNYFKELMMVNEEFYNQFDEYRSMEILNKIFKIIDDLGFWENNVKISFYGIFGFKFVNDLYNAFMNGNSLSGIFEKYFYDLSEDEIKRFIRSFKMNNIDASFLENIRPKY